MRATREDKIGAIGFVLLILGAAGMDSENIIIPVALLLIGALVMGGATWLSCRH